LTFGIGSAIADAATSTPSTTTPASTTPAPSGSSSTTHHCPNMGTPAGAANSSSLG
jgi:hypothetical protein